MSFDWNDYVTLADWLLTNAEPPKTPEAEQRSSISRAYYGAFRLTRDLAEKRRLYVPTGTGADHGDSVELSRTIRAVLPSDRSVQT